MLNCLPNKLDFQHSSVSYKETINSGVLPLKQLTINIEFELAIHILDVLLREKHERSLSTVEKLLLEGIWQHKTYSEIAKENNYSSDYFSNVAAPKLLKQLSKLVRCRVTKKNCQLLVTKYIANFIED